MSLDTLSIARELRDADVAPAQAEAIAAAIGKSVGDEATLKADISTILVKIDGLKSDITLQNEALEQRLTVKIETMRSSLLVWLIGVIVAGLGLLLTVGKAVLP